MREVKKSFAIGIGVGGWLETLMLLISLERWADFVNLVYFSFFVKLFHQLNRSLDKFVHPTKDLF